ncbi:large ribosomal subunit protein bL35m isoform 2-T2 [Discoglossus pictus]
MALPCVRLGAVRRPGLRYISGIVQRSEAGNTALLRPPFNISTFCNIRNASGFCSLVFRPVHSLCRSATTRLAPGIGNLCPTQNLSILNRVTPLLPSILQQPARSVTYFGLRKGKRKTVSAVVKRFLRLHCGLWVRKKAGYKKKLWKKRAARKKRLRGEVFCNKTQCKLLDKMTGPFWKRRNWYVDDPYQKYHNRANLRV